MARVPGLEALEGRRLLSASPGKVRIAEQKATDGTVALVVTGTNKADVIRIEDNGAGTAGNVKVTVNNGAPYTAKGPVALIQVLGRNGDDQVTYTLTGDLAASRSVQVALGNGADRFAAQINGAVATTGILDLEAFGGAGNDVMTVRQVGGSRAGTFFPYLQGDAGDDTLSYIGTGDIAAGATVGPGLTGGDGRDTISVAYSGRVQGTYLYNLTIDGGAGNDVLTNEVHLASGSTGKVGADPTTPAVVVGGDGDDQIRYVIAVDPGAIPAQVNALAVGNAGSDSVARSANVAGDTSNESDGILG